MAEFKNKNKHNFWYSPLMLGILFCIFILLLYKVINLLEKKNETQKKKILAIEQIDNLNKREKALFQDINKLNTEEGIEDIIREKYQVAKKGEKMLVIVEEEEKIKTLTEISKTSNFWNWIKRIFVNNN